MSYGTNDRGDTAVDFYSDGKRLYWIYEDRDGGIYESLDTPWEHNGTSAGQKIDELFNELH